MIVIFIRIGYAYTPKRRKKPFLPPMLRSAVDCMKFEARADDVLEAMQATCKQLGITAKTRVGSHITADRFRDSQKAGLPEQRTTPLPRRAMIAIEIATGIVKNTKKLKTDGKQNSRNHLLIQFRCRRPRARWLRRKGAIR